MKNLFCLALAFVTISGSSLLAGEWTKVALKDCETTGNWTQQKDGTIYLEPREGESGWERYGSYLWLKGQYADFACEFEYKHEAGGNSGFYFRVPDKAKPTTVGVEIQILDCFGKDDLGFHDLGGIIKFEKIEKGAPLVNAAKPAGEWNKMLVTMKNNLLTVEINGKVVQDKVNLEKTPLVGGLVPKGYVGIQDHGLPFWVRNIRIQSLK